MNENIHTKLSAIEKRFEDFDRRLEKLEANPENPRVSQVKQISIREFLNKTNPSNDLQRTLVVAYYLEKFGQLESFNKLDLEEGFELARQNIPSNVNVSVNKNIEKGLLMPVKNNKDNLKAWVVTNTGINLIEKGFENRD